MPTEIRHIIFSAAETILAITAFQRSRGQILPRGRISAAGPTDGTPGEPIGYRLSIVPDEAPVTADGSPTFEIEIDGPSLAAAFIGYCRTKSVPIPMKGTKTLQRFGTQIGLIVTVEGRTTDLRTKLTSQHAADTRTAAP